MEIRNPTDNDFSKAAELCKNFFQTHNVFSKPAEEVSFYLREQSKKNQFIVLVDGDDVKACVFLVYMGQTPDESHKLWKLRHFAYSDEASAAMLLGDAENRIKASSKTCKIEITIADNEQGKEFYLGKGYVQEGALTNHYRNNETTFILGKSF